MCVQEVDLEQEKTVWDVELDKYSEPEEQEQVSSDEEELNWEESEEEEQEETQPESETDQELFEKEYFAKKEEEIRYQ